MRERLLAVDVLPQVHCHQRRDRMRVVGRADGNGVDVLLLVEHHTEVFVLRGPIELTKRLGRPRVVDVAQGDDVATLRGQVANIPHGP